jgi:dynein heavy chain
VYPQAEMTMVNFAVTIDGLEDQLLARLVGIKQPSLEQKRASLINQQNVYTSRLQDLEENLLALLSNSTGDVLADLDLIENLEDTKRVALEIENKVNVP